MESVDASAARLRPAARRTVASWCLWDFAGQAFNTVILTFVFSVYLTNAVADTPEQGQDVFNRAQTIAGLVVAILAPVAGAWADRVRNRRLVVTVLTLVIVGLVGALWFVRPEAQFLYAGAALIALASIVQEIANVLYYAMLHEVSTPETIGRVSGIGWGLGYLGGVLCLIVVLFGFVLGGGWFGLPTADGVNVRAIALWCAGWIAVFAVPFMLWGPVSHATPPTDRFNPFTAYADVIRRIVRLWRDSRGTLHFLAASAIYRDGLAAVFAFAGVIAATSYGFTPTEVIYFGLAANVAAAVGTWVFGFLDDRIGPKPVIVLALGVMVTLGLLIVIWPATSLFWVCGVMIAALVGPVQSASRSLLARIAPADGQNVIFGLYQTAGRAASFIAPALVTLFTVVGGPRWSILGIVVTLAVGLALFAPLKTQGVTLRNV